MAPYEPGAYFSEFGGNSSTTPTTVTVSRGDTLSSIAREAGITVQEILDANPKFTENPRYEGGNLIFSGTTVKIPGRGNPLETALPVEEPIIEVPEQQQPTPEPITPSAIPISTPTASVATPIVAAPVKTAPIDTVLFDEESVPIEVMTDLIFENIGGHELINIARNDIVNGQQVIYQPIKNLSSIQQQYNPNNILSLQSTSDKYFANFSIKLENKVPDSGTGPAGAYVYLDSDTGNIIVEAVNLEVDEQVQIEITISGTIYEAEFGESNS
jgi:hypothetical protein